MYHRIKYIHSFNITGFGFQVIIRCATAKVIPTLSMYILSLQKADYGFHTETDCEKRINIIYYTTVHSCNFIHLHINT